MAKKKEPEVKVDKSSGTVVFPHSCKNEFQNRRYGNGLRLFNVGMNNKVRCTVCGETR
jgi:hypothetical protein